MEAGGLAECSPSGSGWNQSVYIMEAGGLAECSPSGSGWNQRVYIMEAGGLVECSPSGSGWSPATMRFLVRFTLNVLYLVSTADKCCK